jgi:hypothetical protein
MQVELFVLVLILGILLFIGGRLVARLPSGVVGTGAGSSPTVLRDYCDECKILTNEAKVCSFFCEMPVATVPSASVATVLSGNYKMIHHTMPHAFTKWVFYIDVNPNGTMTGASILVINSTYMRLALTGIYIGQGSIILLLLPSDEDEYEDNQGISCQLQIEPGQLLYGSTTGGTVLDVGDRPTYIKFEKTDEIDADYFTTLT